MNQEELTLSQRIASGALSSEEALQYAAAIAQALRRKHQEGAVCGSLDPDHIVLQGSGVKLAQESAGGLTPYTSPERLRGEGIDARSDVFAFGAILYELLSGRRAFAARGPEELKREILEMEPAPLEGISEGVALVLGRCLEKRKENRWQRMGSILIELKLVNAKTRQARQASDWKDQMASLGAQIAALEDTAGRHAALLANAAETSGALGDSVADLQKTAQGHTRAIESIEAAIAQTDEVVEHVVDAVGSMHRSAWERAEATVVPVSHNGS